MASDRYAGWIGQIYSKERYKKEITRRTHKIGDNSFSEEILLGRREAFRGRTSAAGMKRRDG